MKTKTKQLLQPKIRNYSTLFVVLILCSLFLFVSNSKAAVLTVNNAGNGSAQYTSITAAIAVASAGDTLYISPSAASYGSITIDKSLVIVGKGNAADVQQPLQTKIDVISINVHVTSVSILGLQADDINLGIGNNLIAISRCCINNTVSLKDSITNCVISNCIFLKFNNNNIIGGGCNFHYLISGLLIQNNIFYGSIFELVGSSIIQNNIFLTGYDAFTSLTSGQGCSSSQPLQFALVQNNIFCFASAIENTSASCTFYKNITYQMYNGGALGGTNLDGVNPQFTVFTNSGNFSYTYDFHLQPTSPGKNAGTDGKDIGIYGGNYDASLTGEPIGIPVIRKMDLQNFNAPQNGNLNVNVRSTKAR